MATRRKTKLHIDLPAGFFKSPLLRAAFRRFDAIADVTKGSLGGDLYRPPTAEELLSNLGSAEAVIMWSWPDTITDEMLDRLPQMRWSGNIDICQAAARTLLRRGAKVSLIKRGWSPAVAEMALALTLCVLRRASDFHAAMRASKEDWALSDFPDSIDPRERTLTGRPYGIVGFGGIGRRLAELLAPFGCDIRVHDPYLPQAVAKKYGVRKTSLMETIGKSDVVAICAAANPSTRHLIGPREIAAFRKDAVLVNVARARLVDTQALIRRLRKGDMFAAIDVFDVEPLPRKHPLRRLNGAYLTPHRAGGIWASLELILNRLADDLENHLAGRRLEYPLTKAVLPALDA